MRNFTINTMRELFYKPYLSEYKNPVGAVTVNENFIIKIRITERDDVESVYFVLKKENEAKMYYRMYTENDCYCVDMPITSTGLYFYHFEVRQYGGGYFNIFASPNLDPVYHYGDDWIILARERVYEPSDTLSGGLIYQIMVDRFYAEQRNKTQKDAIYRDDWYGTPHYKPDSKGVIRNNDFFGGNLSGIIAKLDYLKSLGVTCIYLNPIFRAKSNHKYDTGDYSCIDPDFGTEEDLKNLIKKAGERGIKIMLDGVFSHTGDDSLYFNKYGNYPTLGAYQGKESPYYKWYTFKPYPDDYECWWGINTLPNVVETEESYNDYINGENGIIAKYTKMGIGGWRLDVADELPDVFLQNLTKRVKSINPKAIVLGEVWEDAVTKVAYSVRRKYFWGRELESVTNYPFKADILEFLKNGDADRLNRTVLTIVDHYPQEVTASLMNMLGTHDTERALTALSKDKIPASRDERSERKITDREDSIKRLKVAATIQYTLPGVPLLFYGDEAGLEGYEDPFNRRCYPWGKEDKSLIEFFTTLGRVRTENIDVLKNGSYNPILAKNGLFIYERISDSGKIKVVANAQKVECVLDKTLHDEITNADFSVLPPLSAIITKE